jgi:LysM repeat protein
VQDDPPERPAVQPERPELRIPKAEKTAQGPEKRPADRRAEVPVVAPPRRLPAGSAAFAEKVDEWMASRTWQKNELELLTILRDSERHDNVQGARGAIEKLMYLPSVEDLKDQLVRRFGNLNTQLLFSGTNTPWTATIAVKRGDTLQRIATEHRTTLEALQKLNPLKDPNRLALGQKLRVLNFPDADLIVHKRLQFAELLFRKRIFKRYYVTVREEAEPGAYPVANETGARAADRLRALIGNIAAEDRDELRMFLAPGSRITVTAQ